MELDLRRKLVKVLVALGIVNVAVIYTCGETMRTSQVLVLLVVTVLIELAAYYLASKDE